MANRAAAEQVGVPHPRVAANRKIGRVESLLRLSDHAEQRAGLRVAGEVDLTCHPDWERALGDVVARSESGEAHLYCAELTFIDARGTELLVQAAGRLAEGRYLVVHHPPPCLRRVLRALWPDGAPAIRI